MKQVTYDALGNLAMLNPKDGSVDLDRAKTYIAMGDIEQALGALKKSIENKPITTPPHNLNWAKSCINAMKDGLPLSFRTSTTPWGRSCQRKGNTACYAKYRKNFQKAASAEREKEDQILPTDKQMAQGEQQADSKIRWTRGGRLNKLQRPIRIVSQQARKW
jgi:hypothetical protein